MSEIAKQIEAFSAGYMDGLNELAKSSAWNAKHLEIIETLQSELAAKDKEITELDSRNTALAVSVREHQAIIEKFEAELQAIRAQEPVAWIQSNHLQKLGQSDMCRCSNFKLMPDYIPLYAHPVIKEVKE